MSLVNEFCLYWMYTCTLFVGKLLTEVLQFVTMSAAKNNKDSSSNQESQSNTQGIYLVSCWKGQLNMLITFINTTTVDNKYYSATTWTGPLGTKLINQSVNWEQRVATFFVNGSMKLKNAKNDLTTKVWNPTKLCRVANLSGNLASFWLVRLDPIFWNIFQLFNVSNGFAKLLNKISWFFHNGLCPLHSIEIESIEGIYDNGRRLS